MDTIQLVLSIVFGVAMVASISCRIYARYHLEVKKKWYGEEE